MFTKLVFAFAIAVASFGATFAQDGRLNFTLIAREPGDYVIDYFRVITNETLALERHEILYTWESENSVFSGINVDVPETVSTF